MCLFTNQTKPIITTEDIIVYKAVSGITKNTVNALYSNFIYTKGILNKTQLYSTKHGSALDEIDLKAWIHETPNKIIEKGFHFAFNSKRLLGLLSYGNTKIAEFLVPKGSEIYKGKEDLGVSNQIIYTGNIIKQKKLKNKKQI